MNKKNNQNHSKETRQENLLALKRAIDTISIEDIVEFDGEWGGAYVVVTSSKDRIFNPETDDDDWYGRKSQCTYVLTKNAEALSKFFAYVGESIMERRDNYLYGFMALLANDFIRQFGDADEYNPLLDYVFSGTSFYLSHFDWQSAMGNAEEAFKAMRFFLSDNISDEEIRLVL